MLSEAPNMNLLWAQWLVEELMRAGVCGFCLSPGSRSTPLTLAVAQNPRAAHRVHFDERGAAYFALGWAKASGKPAVLVCTSGSAAANYWPALAEASMAHVPLILLTADRPPELLQCGANQAIEQTNLYGGYTRWNFTLPCPDPAVPPAMVLTTADQAFYRAARPPAGPVHLNCMFREPLAPSASDMKYRPDQLAPLAAWFNTEAPYTRWNLPETRLTTQQELEIINRLSDVERGALVIGALRNAEETRAAERLAEALAWPVFADVTSGLRLGGASPYLVHYYDQLLLCPKFAAKCAPEFVLHLGGPVTSKRLMRHLEDVRPEYLLAANHPERHDPAHGVTHRLETDIAAFCTWLGPSIRDRGVKPWCLEICALSQKIGEVIDAWLAGNGALSEIFVARAVSRQRRPGHALFLGNSMPIRDMDMYGASDCAWGPAAANRGTSGIDGTLASAVGYARGLNAPVTALLGDLAVLHDLNSMALLRDSAPPVTLVTVNNDGGGIFSFLPVAGYPENFEKYFGVPHGLTFEHAARMFHLPYARPDTCGEFIEAYSSALRAEKAALIEVQTDRAENEALHRALQAHIAAFVETALP